MIAAGQVDHLTREEKSGRSPARRRKRKSRRVHKQVSLSLESRRAFLEQKLAVRKRRAPRINGAGAAGSAPGEMDFEPEPIPPLIVLLD